MGQLDNAISQLESRWGIALLNTSVPSGLFDPAAKNPLIWRPSLYLGHGDQYKSTAFYLSCQSGGLVNSFSERGCSKRWTCQRSQLFGFRRGRPAAPPLVATSTSWKRRMPSLPPSPKRSPLLFTIGYSKARSGSSGSCRDAMRAGRISSQRKLICRYFWTTCLLTAPTFWVPRI